MVFHDISARPLAIPAPVLATTDVLAKAMTIRRRFDKDDDRISGESHVVSRTSIVGLASRNWPFANGSGRIIDKWGSDIRFGSGEQTCRTTDGFGMHVMGDDLIGRHLILSGKFDRSTITVLLDFCRPGDRCIDIGANIGYVACLILNAVPDSWVMCIEPQPDIAALLRKNLAQFGDARSTVKQVALSDSDSEGFLSIDRDNRGASTLVTEKSAETVMVPLLPAAGVFAALDRLDIVKMDVEGHEEAVFRSGAAELARLRPRAILFEDQTNRSGPGGAIGKILADIGYRVFGIGKDLLATRLRPLTDGGSYAFNDYIALPRDRELPAAALRKYGLTASL